MKDYTILGEMFHPKVRKVETARWYIRYRLDDDPKRQVYKCPLFTDAGKSMNRMRKEIERHIAARQPKPEPKPHDGKTFEQHLKDFVPVLQRETTSAKYAILVERYVRADAAALGWVRIEQIDAFQLQDWLADRTLSHATRKRHWSAVSSFCSWLVTKKRLPSHPLAGKAKKRKGEAKTTFSRRALTGKELAALVAAAAKGPVVFGINGPDRAMLYLLCASAGLRAHEASSITPASFDWEEPPTVVVQSEFSKRRRTDVIQLPTALAVQLRAWMEGVAADQQLWPGLWWQRAFKMLYKDLDAAGIKGYDDPKAVVDFHALRTTYVTNIVNTKIPLPLVLKICRLSSAELLKNYYRPTDDAATAAIEKLSVPELSAQDDDATSG